MASPWESFRSVRGVRRTEDEYVEIDLGAGPRRLSRWQRHLDLRPVADAVPVPAEGPVDWSQLDRLPSCASVHWSGPDRGLGDALAAHPGITFLSWDDAAGEAHLPATVRQLRLFCPLPELRVEAPELGYQIDLRMRDAPEAAVPPGLRRVRRLWLTTGGAVSAAALAHLSDLERLRLTFAAAPGSLADVPALARHDRLVSLWLDGAYNLDPAALPDLPALRHLVLAGTRRTTEAAVRERFAGGPVALEISGAKSAVWLSANLDNPFRDWVDVSRPFAEEACAAYRRAARSAAAATDPEAAERALRRLVADLSAINDAYDLIDTVLREQAWAAYHGLAARLGVPAQPAGAWFEEERRF
ncbi:hypothetical protein [Dactylosporangium darangshiense]|uniref:hypothetical protein n=1 Tax=Dactylosporangium darangshiense TaxID=579108 RepID=UPI0031F00924